MHPRDKAMIRSAAKSPTLTGRPSKPPESTYEEGAVNAVDRPRDSKDLQTRINETIKNTGKQQLEQECCDEVKMADGYVKFENKFIEKLSDFQLIWDGLLRRTHIAKHRIHLSPTDTKPIHSASY